MAKAVRRTVKGSGKKKASAGTRPCNICHGTGRVPAANFSRKKK